MTGRGLRLFCFELILILTAALIWEAEAVKRTEKAQGDTLTNQELHRLLSLFNTTPQPPKSTSQRPNTTPSTSFVPTEVFPPRNLKTVRRKDVLKSVNRDGDAASANLLQQLSVLSSFLEASGVQAQQKTTPAVQEEAPPAVSPATEPTPTTTGTTPPTPSPSLPVNDPAAALQSLALLSALFGSNANSGGTPANLAALLGVDAAPSAPIVRQTQQATLDPAAAALTSLLLAQAGLGPQQLQQSSQAGDATQNFQTFSNTQSNLDPADSNQLTTLLSLLGTLGNLAGGSQQAPSLFNFGQTQQQQPNLLASLLGGHQAPAQSPETSTNFLASLLGGNQQQQQQNNVLATLLGNQGGANSLFSQPQSQPPGVLASLGNLGTSLFSVAGSTLGGLSGTKADGKPRVRGVDTRLGLGYRLGQNADAQVMMEIGPQLFTEALPNEHRPGVPTSGVNTNTIRDIRQPSTQQIQQLIEDEIAKQSQLQRRNQLQKLSKAELEHQQIGQLLHAAGYYNPPKRSGNLSPPRTQQPFRRPQQPPLSRPSLPPPMSARVRQMFPYQYPGPRPRFHHHFQAPPPRYPTPINNYYRNMPPPTLLQPKNDPAWNVNNRMLPVPTSRPTEAVKQVPAPVPTPARKEANESDGYSMLTEYEKWLVKRGASAQELQTSVAKRILPFNDENSELSRAGAASSSANSETKVSRNKNQFSFHASPDPVNPNLSPTGKIVRMTQKRPATIKAEIFHNRVGNFPREHQQPPPPFSGPRNANPMPSFRHHQPVPRNFRPHIPHAWRPPPGPSPTFAGHWSPNNRRQQSPIYGAQPRPPIRRSHQALPPQQMSLRDHPRPQHFAPPHPPTAPIDRSSYNPYQNFVMEADDSFLRRNAPTNIENERIESQPSSAAGATPKPSANSDGGSKQRLVKAGSTAMKVLKEVITPAMKYLRPTVDSLHPFAKPLSDYENGDYTPTKEPLLIATPTPTPVPSLYDHLGRKNPNHLDQTPAEQENAVVHVGEGLSYEDLASSLRIKPKGKKRKKKPSKDEEDSDAEESKPNGPLNAPGVEMFIDIESGEVSVRKPIASLTHFGEVTTTTTAEPEPKTEDEIEDEESGKIFESLQEHFKENYENFQVTQAALQAAKERKEKIKQEEDESLGLVNRYFDLLNDGDEEAPASRRKRHGTHPIAHPN